MNGHQRWYCKECGHIFVRHYALSNEVLYTDYLFGKQTIQQLAVSYHLSARQIQRRLHHVENQGICHSTPRPVAIQMDATYWATDNGLLVIKDAHRGDVLWRKFLNKKETVADYMEGVYDLCSKGYTVIGAVADGLRGLRQALGNIPFQYCQFHAIRFVRIQLTTRPKTIPGQQLSAIANGMAHTDKESFEGALSQWFEQWRDYINERTKSENGRSFYTHRRLRTAALSLKRNMDVLWTFYTRPELGLPNTNNAMESFFARVKKLAGVHNGLNAEHKRTMIDAYISVYNTDKQRTQDTF